MCRLKKKFIRKLSPQVAVQIQPQEQIQVPPPQVRPQVQPETDGLRPSLESRPVVSFPDGVKVLYDTDDAIVDICFVHGLTGNRDSTWTARGQSAPWPQTLLPPKLQKARILTYGYDAYVVGKSIASPNQLIDHSTNLLNDLTADRAHISSRPIIFVAHSLGGLVCKKAILLSRNNPEAHLRGIFDCTKGIIFLGTPHTGSWMADWAKIPVSCLGIVKSVNKSLLQTLKTDDQLIRSVQLEFLSMIRDLRESDRRLNVTCFFEELPLPVVGKVVSKDSATFSGYNLISIHANHSDMTKFASSEETGFKRVLGELVRWEAEIRYSAINETFDEEALASVDLTKIALDLFKIPDSDRARAAVSKCVEAMNLKESVKKIGYFHIRNRPETPKESLRKLESHVAKIYSSAVLRCLKSITFLEMGARQANIERPAEDTCMWIYGNPIYRSWASQLNTLLWIKGKPGSGKSTLMKSFYSKRRQAAVSDGTIHLSFFFNARGAAVEKTPIGLYITLLHGLLRQVPLLMCEFLPTFLEKELYSQTGKVVWQLLEVSDAFHSIIGQKQSKCIEVIIDALDECEDEEVRSVVRRFEISIESARSSGAELKVCWSSRYYPHISLKSKHGFELQLDQQNGADIRRYVEAEFPAYVDSSLLSIREDLISRANGVFLWAALVSRRLLKAMDQGKDEQELKELLQSIPGKLDDLFDDIFKQVQTSTKQSQELIRIAQWILCSFRPLTTEELFTALSFQNSTAPLALSSINPSGSAMERLKNRIIDVSGGLFEVAKISANNSRVQVIHESVREFFLGRKGLKLLQMPSWGAFVIFGHKELALVCFQALLAKEFDSVGLRGGLGSRKSITEVLKYLMVPWEPPKDTFLRTYVQDFVFEHFDHARDNLASESPPGSPFEGLQTRRRALVNFLRLRCSEIIEGQILRPGFSSHMQRVTADPASFAISDAELSRLVAFHNNLSACASFFSSKDILLRKEIDKVDVSYKSKNFIALFFMNPAPHNVLEAFSTQSALEIIKTHGHEALRQLDTSSIQFVFGMTFTVHDWANPTLRLQYKVDEEFQFRLWRFGKTKPTTPLVLSDWTIAEDLDEIAELREFEDLVKNFTRAPFHKYPHPTMLCLVLRSSTAGEDNSVTTGTDSVPRESEGMLLGYGERALSKEYLWRPRKHGRDREVFEADTDSDPDSDS